jgi:hypothetical protein
MLGKLAKPANKLLSLDYTLMIIGDANHGGARDTCEATILVGRCDSQVRGLKRWGCGGRTREPKNLKASLEYLQAVSC